MTYDHAEHAAGIGGTDIAAIMGLSRWRTPHAVYCEKVGLDAPQPETEAMRWGNILEPVILAEYGQRQGVTVAPGGTRRGEREWERCQLDGVVVGWPVIVEAKAVGIAGRVAWHLWGDEGTDEVPQDYLCQAHWQLVCCPEMESAHVAALLAGSGLRIYIVQRHAEFEAYLRERAERFWIDHVKAQVPPPLDASDDCARFLSRIHPRVVRAETLESTPTLDEVAERLRRARETRVAAEAAEELEKNRLRAAIGNAAGLRGPWGRASWHERKKGSRVLSVKFNAEVVEEAS